MRKQIWHSGILLLAAMAFATAPAWPQASVHGTGTAGKIPVWTNGTTIGNSVMTQSGGNLTTTGGFTASGGITGASFTGSGLGLTGVAKLGSMNSFTANQSITGSVTAMSFTGDGTNVGNVNAAKLGGSLASAFAQLGSMNTFTVDQAITGNLSLTGSINDSLTLQGDVSNGGATVLSSNVIGGYGGGGGHPPNSVTPGVVAATIAGGGGWNIPGVLSLANTVTADLGTVGGGVRNTASGEAATVAGGGGNTASGLGDTVSGGNSNVASNDYATISGGQNNTADHNYATVAGGDINKAQGTYATVGGGQDNTASGNGATVAGGGNNTAAGPNSFAAGDFATANNQGSFVWSDGSRPTSDFGTNEFIARASGGFVFFTTGTDDTTAAWLPTGSTAWTIFSDRNAKANFASVDGPSLLEKLAAIPILTWNYKTQATSIRHMGPMAQDFRAAFGLGEDEKHISSVDGDGVSLAAIQALYKMVVEKVAEKDKEIEQLRARLDRLEQKR